ncbi:hypothetical protein [Streptomyces cucumeris]|uniref:hypothetical protein n=1 Tax=Streptomyces cucumeris TaxID=2962890 RepID=UPI0020C9263A|nr:hypothetical protein [Streptomyces sp. NEAU-Y11]MCP9209727.1 hypothetical protein [Streptomyces sp. NEAU-Y11]
MVDEITSVACLPGLSHGAFRLYAILAGVARQKDAQDSYFPVTLTGLQKVHPGTSGKCVGYVTILNQISELRRRDLLEIRASLNRNKPGLPVLVRVLYRNPSTCWIATDGSSLTASDVESLIDVQSLH